MQNDQEIFADNAAPFNMIKLISAGMHDGLVKRHIVDIAAQTVSKEFQLSAQSTKSVTIVKQKYTITSIAMSNDTHTLFVANNMSIITQFQKEDSSLNYYPIRTFKGHTSKINQVSLSNSKMHLLSASDDFTLRVWDLQNGTQLACLNVERKEHDYYYNYYQSCCWNGQDTLFALGMFDGNVVVWSPPLSNYNTSDKFTAICKFQSSFSSIRCLKFQENGLDLFVSYESGVILLWSVNEKELLDSKSTHQQNAALPIIKQPKRESEKLNGDIYSFDVRGNMLVVGVRIRIFSLRADSLQSMTDAIRFEIVLWSPINSLEFSKDGKYVASGSGDASVAIYDSKSGKCVKHIKDAHSGSVIAIMFQI